MAEADRLSEEWQELPWKQYHRNVYRLQQRIYQAKRRNQIRQVHNLQRLLLRSWSARCIAVRQVTQDNRGKRTAGVDGVASLTPQQRLVLAQELCYLDQAADPVRRVYIPKTETELRPLGIPTMVDRARQALVKLGLEPEWEAVFEPNSYGFRPGRSAHDALEAIWNFIRLKPKYVLDADIEKCFERISHTALLAKLSTIQPIAKLIGGWLKAGIMDNGQLLYPEAGTPQGGVISPLLMNVALHGLEQALVGPYSKRERPAVIRYADDLVILHHDLTTLKHLQTQAEVWLKSMGLHLKASKTKICHTLESFQGEAGFDFLGFTIRQVHVGRYKIRSYRGQVGFKTLITPSQKAQQRHLAHLKHLIRHYRGSSQAGLIVTLNPIIRGWTNYYRTCCAKRIFNQMTARLFYKLLRWAAFRHPRQDKSWWYRRYWRRYEGKVRFSDGEYSLYHYEETKIRRHTKVMGHKSPYDGDWVYWAGRLERDPLKPLSWVKLLKRQCGKCEECGLRLTTEDVIEVHHLNGNRADNRYANLSLIHGHCHDLVHARC